MVGWSVAMPDSAAAKDDACSPERAEAASSVTPSSRAEHGCFRIRDYRLQQAEAGWQPGRDLGGGRGWRQPGAGGGQGFPPGVVARREPHRL